MRWRISLACLAVAWLLGCSRGSVSVGVGSERTLTVHGITYIIPWESGSHSETPASFEYKGDTLTIVEQNGQLAVNGRALGAITAGDKVTFTNGVTFVNGQARTAPK
jgi:hypothetical protein